MDGQGLEAQGVQQALAEHLSARIDDFDETLVEVVETINDLSGRGWTPETLLARIQVSYDVVDPRAPASDLLNVTVPVTRKKIQHWFSRSQRIADLASATTAFARFADLEDELEKVENPL